MHSSIVSRLRMEASKYNSWAQNEGVWKPLTWSIFLDKYLNLFGNKLKISIT